MDIKDLYRNCYTPYSEKPSIGIVLSKEGSCFPGCRVENISYPLSIEAVQNALFCCLSEGHKPKEVLTTEVNNKLLQFWEKELDVNVKAMDTEIVSNYPLAEVTLDSGIDVNKKLEELLNAAIVGESNFPVAALLETEMGYFSGVNIECSSWDMGLCAERIAIAKALTYGSKNFKKLHIHTREGEFSSPCGACRQVILEHMPNRRIHLHHADHSESIHFSNDLLPHSFSSSALSNK
ncbi:MAG: cytidine deaminase [Balneolaceae bacterium]|jgi:homotetrameric cytidine deaminase